MSQEIRFNQHYRVVLSIIRLRPRAVDLNGQVEGSFRYRTKWRYNRAHTRFEDQEAKVQVFYNQQNQRACTYFRLVGPLSIRARISEAVETHAPELPLLFSVPGPLVALLWPTLTKLGIWKLPNEILYFLRAVAGPVFPNAFVFIATCFLVAIVITGAAQNGFLKFAKRDLALSVGLVLIGYWSMLTIAIWIPTLFTQICPISFFNLAIGSAIGLRFRSYGESPREILSSARFWLSMWTLLALTLALFAYSIFDGISQIWIGSQLTLDRMPLLARFVQVWQIRLIFVAFFLLTLLGGLKDGVVLILNGIYSLKSARNLDVHNRKVA